VTASRAVSERNRRLLQRRRVDGYLLRAVSERNRRREIGGNRRERNRREVGGEGNRRKYEAEIGGEGRATRLLDKYDLIGHICQACGLKGI
jgi:hypothetical protein